MKIKNIEVEWFGGTDVNVAVDQAVDYAIENKCVASFSFNGVNFKLNAKSLPTKAVDQYLSILNSKPLVTG